MFSRSSTELICVAHIRTHISVNLISCEMIAQSFDQLKCSSLEAILKLNVRFAMCSSDAHFVR